LERRDHIGGNCYTEEIEGVHVHRYGAHIFRTDDVSIWNYIGNFAEFNNFVNSPIAKYKDELYNLPFNMNTFSKLWGIQFPDEAKKIIKQQSQEQDGEAANLEEHAIHLVGRDIYEKLIKGYTEKQWGKSCRELPASIMKRIPLRFTYDNNYYNARYQGIPKGGYTRIFEKMFEGCPIIYNSNYVNDPEKYRAMARNVIYTGPIDEFFGYKYGELEYRSLKFETKILNTDNYQGVAVVNYTDKDVPYTRSIEHKHFEFGNQKRTVISWEYPVKWDKTLEPYYPVNDEKNNALYKKYLALKKENDGVIFGGRLGEYRYYDMQDTIKSALDLTRKIL
jgi:UDP-galactopyranose mutase